MTPADSDALVRIAHVTARAIGDEAIVDQGRCNWIGAAVRESPDGRVLVDHQSLDSSLYEGTAGIALFLAETSRLTDDPALADVAAAAINQALDRAGSAPPDPSFYTGDLGIAAAGRYVARLLDDEKVDARAAALRARVVANPPRPFGFDLLTGLAGAIAGLLSTATEADDDGMDLAFLWGEQLVGLGERSEESLSWDHPAMTSRGHLTGLSHGASGAAVVLAELGRRTGEPAFTSAAGQALAFESTTFDRTQGNWPDRRVDPHDPTTSSHTSYAPFWCNGAPGIVAARATLTDTLNATQRAEASAGLRTTALTVRTMTGHGENFSVCHGASGNAEVVLEAASCFSTDDAGADILSLPEQTIREGFDRHVVHGSHSWPSGVRGHVSPTLFLGAAGPGRLALRLAHPYLPSLLTPPSPRDWGRALSEVGA